MKKNITLFKITACGAFVGSSSCGSSTPPLLPPCAASGGGPPASPPGGVAEACWQNPPSPSLPRPLRRPYLSSGAAFHISRISSVLGGSQRCTPSTPISHPPRSLQTRLPGFARRQGGALALSGHWSHDDAEVLSVGAVVGVEEGEECLEIKAHRLAIYIYIYLSPVTISPLPSPYILSSILFNVNCWFWCLMF